MAGEMGLIGAVPLEETFKDHEKFGGNDILAFGAHYIDHVGKDLLQIEWDIEISGVKNTTEIAVRRSSADLNLNENNARVDGTDVY